MRNSFDLTNKKDKLPINNCTLFQRQQSRKTSNKGYKEHTVQQLRKIVKHLEATSKQQKQKREAAQDKLLLYRQRIVYKQQQFHRILEKFGITEAINPKNSHGELCDQIYKKFDSLNQNALTILQTKFETNRLMMNRRIDEVLNHVKQQLNKNKQLSQQSFHRIKKQIEDILYLAVYIEQQNTKFRTKIGTLQFKIKVLNEQRDFILQQLLSKKKIISKYMKKQSQFKIEQTNQKFVKPNMPILFQTITKLPQYSNTIDTNTYVSKAISSRPKTPKTVSKMNNSFNNNGSIEEKTIAHLKMCLQRQRKKRYQMGKVVNEMQTKNKEINQAIQACLKKQKRTNNENDIQILLKSEKLFQVIRDIKKRLAMVQTPVVNCGWVNEDLLQIIQAQ